MMVGITARKKTETGLQRKYNELLEVYNRLKDGRDTDKTCP